MAKKFHLEIFFLPCRFWRIDQILNPPHLSVKLVTEGEFEQFLNNSRGQRQAQIQAQVLTAACLIVFHSYAGFQNPDTPINNSRARESYIPSK